MLMTNAYATSCVHQKIACVSVSGCYISKCVYYRTGEKSLDCYYRPYHRVEYYRYVRFFPEGKISDTVNPVCFCYKILCNVILSVCLYISLYAGYLKSY